MITSVRLFILYLFVAFYYPTTTAFSTVQLRTKISIFVRRCNAIIPHNLSANSNDGNTKKKGDSLRDATGIRPSLHPTSLVEVHLLIEDIEKREQLDTEEKQLEFLRTIAEFSGRTVEEGGAEDDAEIE